MNFSTKTIAIILSLLWTNNAIAQQSFKEIDLGSLLFTDAKIISKGKKIFVRDFDNGGKVMIYNYSDPAENWKRDTTFYGNDPKGNFGIDIAVSDSGNCFAVYSFTDSKGEGEISVYSQNINKHWKRIDNGNFKFYTKLSLPDKFLSLSSDGITLAFSIPQTLIGGPAKIQVHKFINGKWQQKGNEITFQRPEPCYLDNIKLSGDGNHLIASLKYSNCLKLYKFFKGNWLIQKDCFQRDKNNQGVSDGEIDISDNGNFLITGNKVGCGDVNNCYENGSISLFSRNSGDDSWSNFQTTLTLVGKERAELGHHVAMSGDGKRIIVSSRSKQTTGKYILASQYDFINGKWKKIKDFDYDPNGMSVFSADVSISKDGSYFVLIINGQNNLIRVYKL